MKKETPKKCPVCNKNMRKWFNQQIHIGYSCDNCGKFEDITNLPELGR